MDRLEELLKNRDILTEEFRAKAQYVNNQPSIQRAENNATLFDLIKMISKLVNITMKDLNVVFEANEGSEYFVSSDRNIDHSYITYKIISREPKGELKPRHRQLIRENDYDKEQERVGEIYGQKFKCILQFNIFATTYEEAEKILNKFEELMITYTGYFKKKGVAELLFNKQFTDEHYDIFRQKISIRNIQYYVEIEKLTVIFREKIKDIEILIDKEEV